MMFGYGSNSAFTWLWLAGGVALIGFIVGLILFVVGRSAVDQPGTILARRLASNELAADEHARMQETMGSSTRGGGMARLGAALAVLSLVVILVLGGLTLAGTWPRPGPGSIGPGSPGFAAGTVADPRVVRIVAGPGLQFYPDAVSVAAGETITFEVTTMGWTAHEFMVGPAADVAADREDTPEIADIGMMQAKSLTFTFDGPGPFAFACHAPGHYEAGMKGTITIQP